MWKSVFSIYLYNVCHAQLMFKAMKPLVTGGIWREVKNLLQHWFIHKIIL